MRICTGPLPARRGLPGDWSIFRPKDLPLPNDAHPKTWTCPLSGQSRGFTLVEILLVLSIVAVAGAVIWWGVQRPLARQRARSAADTVRTEWCQARVGAMRSGHPYTFQYMVGGDRYRVAPQENLSSPDPASLTADEYDLMEIEECLSFIHDRSLPEGIRFLAPDAPSGPADAVSTTSAASSEGEGWSDPIFFYPDGTTSDAQLVLAAGQNCVVRLLLRGVTGTVTVGDGAE